MGEDITVFIFSKIPERIMKKRPMVVTALIVKKGWEDFVGKKKEISFGLGTFWWEISFRLE